MKAALRNQVVTFRLTNEEYVDLRKACEDKSSSLSDTARNAVLAVLHGSTPASLLPAGFQNIGEKLDQIMALLHTLTATLGSGAQSEAK